MTISEERSKIAGVKPTAGRVAFLIDGAAYFEALVDAVKQAKKSVYIAAWDIDSRTELLRRAPMRTLQPDWEIF